MSMKSVATLAFVLVLGGYVGANSLPYHVKGSTTGRDWGIYASTTSQATPGAIGAQARAWHSPYWQNQ